MFTVRVDESFAFSKPKVLNENQSKAWEYFSKVGWHFIYMHDLYMVIPENSGFDGAYVFRSYARFLEWLAEAGRDLKDWGLIE